MITEAKIPYFNIFSADSKSLLQQLLVQDPRRRLGFNGIDEIKSHPFFDGIDWSEIPKMLDQVVPEFKPLPKEQEL